MADNLKITTAAAASETMKPALPNVKEHIENTDRRIEKSIVSGDGSAVAVRNGQVTVSANDNAQIKCTPSGTVDVTGLQHNVTANRMNLHVDEVTINNHVLNNRLFELTDFKQSTTNIQTQTIIGNFCVLGTVLVKAWEPDLKRYVFIRRMTRMPMFSPATSPPAMMDGMELSDATSVNVDINGVMDSSSSTAVTTGTNTNTSNQTKLASNESQADTSGNTNTTKAAGI